MRKKDETNKLKNKGGNKNMKRPENVYTFSLPPVARNRIGEIVKRSEQIFNNSPKPSNKRIEKKEESNK